MTDQPRPFLPPRWVIRAAWRVHRRLYALSGKRFGLRLPKPDQEGLMRVIATGRHSGEDRAVMLAYLTDGPNLITMAMNGWGEGEPSWWLNLQAHPEAIAELRDRTITITARAATPAEHERHWEHYRTVTPKLDAYAANRSTATTMIVLEPVDAS